VSPSKLVVKYVQACSDSIVIGSLDEKYRSLNYRPRAEIVTLCEPLVVIVEF